MRVLAFFFGNTERGSARGKLIMRGGLLTLYRHHHHHCKTDSSKNREQKECEKQDKISKGRNWNEINVSKTSHDDDRSFSSSSFTHVSEKYKEAIVVGNDNNNNMTRVLVVYGKVAAGVHFWKLSSFAILLSAAT